MPSNRLVPHRPLSYLDPVKTFGQVLESADQLSVEEQETLVAILGRRLAEQRRAELVLAVKEARAEYKAGRCHAASPADIVIRFPTIIPLAGPSTIICSTCVAHSPPDHQANQRSAGIWD